MSSSSPTFTSAGEEVRASSSQPTAELIAAGRVIYLKRAAPSFVTSGACPSRSSGSALSESTPVIAPSPLS